MSGGVNGHLPQPLLPRQKAGHILWFGFKFVRQEAGGCEYICEYVCMCVIIGLVWNIGRGLSFELEYGLCIMLH